MKSRLIRYVTFFLIFFISYYFFIGQKDFWETLKVSIVTLLIDILIDMFMTRKRIS